MTTPFTGTETYVDPSIAADSGAGTIGDPYGDLEYAFESVTRNSTEGDRFNVKAGTDEILAVQLGVAIAVYGTPSATAPLIIQGYTAEAGDGGIGGISGGASVAIIDQTALNSVYLTDLHLHNTGANLIINLDSTCSIVRCEIDNSTSTGNTCEMGINSLFMSNYVHNVAGTGIRSSNGSLIQHNTFENGINDMITAISTTTGYSTVQRNIIDIDGATNGILGCAGFVMNNSIYSAGGSGQGLTQSNGVISQLIANNIVEGFSAGGTGYKLDSNNSSVPHLIANSSFNNDTHYDGPDAGDIWVNHGWGSATDSNEITSVTAFTDAPNGDFSTIDTGNIKEGSEPQNYPG
ncbi:MAG: hypothetical protein GY918_14880 [Gammaproteobacteria bacterium]|nr:hypothetical protein [Gammaproteobacteria bacterium]